MHGTFQFMSYVTASSLLTLQTAKSLNRFQLVCEMPGMEKNIKTKKKKGDNESHDVIRIYLLKNG